MDLASFKEVPVWVYLLVLIIILLYKYLTSSFDYWKKRGVPGDKPYIFMGTLKPFWIYPIQQEDMRCARKYGRFYGGFEGTRPILFTTDPELIRQITVKDFNSFQNRRKFPGIDRTKYIKLSVSVLNGDEWKSMRNTLTPAFTTGKLKQMVCLIEECVEQMVKSVEVKVDKGESLDMATEFTLLTLSVIASCAFGLKIDGMDNPHSEFVQRARKAFRAAPKMFYIAVLFPKLFEIFPVSMINAPFEYFGDTASKAIDFRLRNKDSGRRDFMQIMLDAEVQDQDGNFTSKANKKNSKMTRDSITGQIILFLLAGFETTASTLSLAVYELARNPKIQDKLLAEIDDVMNECEGKITYEVVARMQYLDMVVSEILRLYPPAVRIERKCEFDGTSINGIKLNRGVLVQVPIFCLHYDPEFFPNPEVFDPERFSPENKAKRNPFTYLPFGVGPRNCIAMRFALMELKVVMVFILSNFRFQTCEKTEFPLKYNNGFPIRSPVSIHLMLQKRIDQPHF